MFQLSRSLTCTRNLFKTLKDGTEGLLWSKKKNLGWISTDLREYAALNKAELHQKTLHLQNGWLDYLVAKLLAYLFPSWGGILFCLFTFFFFCVYTRKISFFFEYFKASIVTISRKVQWEIAHKCSSTKFICHPRGLNVSWKTVGMVKMIHGTDSVIAALGRFRWRVKKKIRGKRMNLPERGRWRCQKIQTLLIYLFHVFNCTSECLCVSVCLCVFAGKTVMCVSDFFFNNMVSGWIYISSVFGAHWKRRGYSYKENT